jgi:hypothetical protein
MMESITESSWRLYPATTLGLAGIALVVYGIRWQIEGLCRSAHNSQSLLRALCGFRMMVIGIGLTGAAVAWQWTIVWLFALSVAVAGEETFESSVMIGALRHERPRGRPGSMPRLANKVQI